MHHVGCAIVLGWVVVAPEVAADPAPDQDGFATIRAADGTAFVRQLVPPTSVARAQSRTLYLNHRGVTLWPGPNDARAQTSTIVSKPTTIRGWNADDDDWEETVSCMRAIWSPFDVVVTDVDPGATPHIEALFGGSPADVGMASNVGGVSPFTANCGIIENSIVFAFTDNLPRKPRVICEVMAQEIGHSFGLDHELLAADPMTYLSYARERSFQDEAASCGETKARPCGIAGTVCRPDQNSVQLLRERLGAAGEDHTPPVVGVTSPSDHAVVEPGFTVTATASDDVGVTAVTFYLDGDRVATTTAPPFAIATELAIAAGRHAVTVEAADARGNTTVAEIEVVLADSTADDPALGCTAGGAPGSGAAALALVAVVRRRRARPVTRTPPSR